MAAGTFLFQTPVFTDESSSEESDQSEGDDTKALQNPHPNEGEYAADIADKDLPMRVNDTGLGEVQESEGPRDLENENLTTDIAAQEPAQSEKLTSVASIQPDNVLKDANIKSEDNNSQELVQSEESSTVPVIQTSNVLESPVANGDIVEEEMQCEDLAPVHSMQMDNTLESPVTVSEEVTDEKMVQSEESTPVSVTQNEVVVEEEEVTPSEDNLVESEPVDIAVVEEIEVKVDDVEIQVFDDTEMVESKPATKDQFSLDVPTITVEPMQSENQSGRVSQEDHFSQDIPTITVEPMQSENPSEVAKDECTQDISTIAAEPMKNKSQSVDSSHEQVIKDNENQCGADARLQLNGLLNPDVRFSVDNSSETSSTKVHKSSPRLMSRYRKNKKKKNESEVHELTPFEKFQNFVQENISMKMLDKSHTPTTCYGNIEFKETTKRSTGRFIRCADDTDPKQIFTLLTEYWKLKKPQLLISVTGGAMSFDLAPRLKKDFTDGLLKVASTPGTWVISGGTNTGVMKLVGDANHGTNNVCIGIATWGIVAERDTLQPTSIVDSKDKANKLLGVEQRRSGETFPYRLGSYLVQKGEAFLDYNHTHFILVDNGTVGQWGKEIGFRGRFEDYLIQHKPNLPKIPSVLLVLEGGPGTLKTVYEAVKNSIPCVIIEGSGRAADVLVYAIRSADQILAVEEGQHEGLKNEIMCVFDLKDEEKILGFTTTILNCIRKKEVFTVSNMRAGMDTDDAILTALLKDKSTSPSHYEQMRLAILWDRVDLAETKIMSNVGSSWVPRTPKVDPNVQLSKEEKKKFQEEQATAAQHELNELMIMALAMDKPGFVKLLLGYGVSIKSLLTKQLLQFLYAYRRNIGHSTMRYELEMHPIKEPCEDYKALFQSLLEYNHKRSTRSKTEGVQEVHLKDVSDKLRELLRSIPDKILGKVVEIPGVKMSDSVSRTMTFDAPFRQLFIWAVLNNMLDMALLLWEFEDDAICKALVAAELTNGLIYKIRNRNVQDEVARSLELSLSTYQNFSLDLLDLCYKTHEKNTELLITMRLSLLGDLSSSLDFAVASEQRNFVSHSSVQGILNDVWTGSISQRHIDGFKVCTCICFPFLLRKLEIRTRKEMKQMIQASHFDDSEDEEEISVKKKGKKKAKSDHEDRDDEEDWRRLDTMEKEAKRSKERGKLPFYKKFYYFHVYSPVVRFYVHTFGYLLFLMLFSYVAMVKKTSNIPTGLEILLIITVVGYAVSEIYQLVHIDAPSFALKMKDYVDDIWNKFDVVCLLVFVIAIILRCIPSTVEYGHLLYTIDVSLWIIRLINILYVSSVAGPYVVMIGHMFGDLINFLVILVIFLFAYGVSIKGILDPTPDNAQMFVASIFKPYFHWHGEYFLDAPEDENTTYFGTEKHNSYAEPIALIYMGLYLLIVNILLLNLVIAVFNSTYEKIMAIALRVWKFQRYGLIIEYAQRRGFLFPPLSLIYHFYIFIRWLLSRCTGVEKKKCDSGLKQHVTMDALKKRQLRELESNCLIKLSRKRKKKQTQSENSDSSVSQHKDDKERKFAEQQSKMMERLEDMGCKLDIAQNALQRTGIEGSEVSQDRTTAIEHLVLREEKAKRDIESLEESVRSKQDELIELKKKFWEKEIREKDLVTQTEHLQGKVNQLQVNNKIYLQEISKKTEELKEKERRIKEFEDYTIDSFNISGIEN